MEKIALLGGEKAKTVPYSTGKRFGEEELFHLREALEQNTLFYWFGKKTKQFCEKFANMCGTKYCLGTSSGTAAIHVALGAVGVGPGDEVITSPITDMGSIIGILMQNAIPVFADLDPHTYNMTAESVEAKITDKTKAVVVVHLAGNPAEIDKIVEVCRKRNIYVVEDCAQAYCCKYKGQLVGTFGDIGCFSLNDFKHISAGDGGMCITNDEKLYERAFAFTDKNYNRLSKNMRNVPFIAPNYRINELTSAVGIAQLDRVEDICAKRNKYGEALTAAIKEMPGLHAHKVLEGGESSYWFYMLRVDEEAMGVSRSEFSEALRAEGLQAGDGYLPTCVYELPLFANNNFYEDTKCPIACPYYGGKAPEYKHGLCPNAEEILATAINLPVKEFYTEQDLEETIHGIRKVYNHFKNA